ncbi:arsenite efflux ATP-binding protein ArsA [Antricoccus suffuscus]|uniref:Arsenite efflux ATP-binding protein ArsA n=1 Tax=Antricoccus suffuscus TaxID=1629062 RepID=A0A2T1A396_9ACTN|nr:ArsA family ATPase [Antricoccus suffuscus]PRZ43079.1 arsenite efflux ATP-binding protein ArsA [Antricoccus suffuscus]
MSRPRVHLRPRAANALDLDELLGSASTRVVVCCGAGGVGKTTTSASIALRAADAGRQVVVLTIDPARRLAQSLGIDALGNTPLEVKGVDPKNGGRLFAMMLDMKTTFDEIVLSHTTPERAEQIFENPFYQTLSTSFAGTQEYMAMEKLGQLVAADEWDLIIVDTPPSRSALDFLDAPERMARFLDGKVLKLLLAPAKTGGRMSIKLVSAGMGMFTRILTKIVGGQVLQDISAFVGALDTMFGGFRARATATYELLRQPGTSFLVVATPEPDALREASYFVDRLVGEAMPLTGVVMNRVHYSEATELPAKKARDLADELWPNGEDVSQKSELAAAALRIHADRVDLALREQKLTEKFVAAHPDVSIGEIGALAEDAHDLDDLREVGSRLAGDR